MLLDDGGQRQQQDVEAKGQQPQGDDVEKS